MKKLIILSIAILTTLSCCKKEDPQPNFGFSCNINDRFWTPRYEHWCPSCHAFVSSYYPNGARIYAPGTLQITAQLKTDERSETIYIYVKYLHEGNNVKMVELNGGSIFMNHQLEGKCWKYAIDTAFNNRFVITNLDTINKKIAGEFDIRAISLKCNPPDTVYLTEGKFDISPLWFK